MWARVYLDAVKRRRLGETVSVLSEHAADSLQLRAALVKSMAALLRSDHVASYVWDDESACFVDGVTSDADPSMVSVYEQDAQFADHIAGPLRARLGPTRVCDVIPQRSLVRSPFYDHFLRPAGLHWGLNLFAVHGSVDLGDLRIWRTRARGDFTSEEVGLTRLLYPAITAALRRCGQGDRRSGDAFERLDAAAWLRHVHGLSRRQAEVALLVAEGFADKEVARRLGIGFTTARTHLKEGLARLGCLNRKELIRFIARSRVDPDGCA